MPRHVRLVLHDSVQLLVTSDNPRTWYKKVRTLMTSNMDMTAQGLDQEIETLPGGNALGSFSTQGCASSTSCPASSAGSASTYACLG